MPSPRDGTHVWVANSDGNSVTRALGLDRRPGQGHQRLELRVHADAVTSDGTQVRVANEYGTSVTELSASTGAWSIISGSATGSQPDAVTSDGTHVWVANEYGTSVTELSASTGALVKVIRGSSYGFDYPSGITSDGTHVWVANYWGNSVTEFSAS